MHTSGIENDPIFSFTEKSGPYSVGLRVVEQYDYSRVFRSATDELGKPHSGERSRPLQTLIWYPSEGSTGKPMTVRDYGNLWATETTFDTPLMPARANELLSGMKRTLDTSLWAVRDAHPISGRFPVVIYAPSFSAPSWENADLCEYLASYGYVIVSSPCMGATTRDMTQDVAGANAQARDISFLIGYARTLPNADISQIAVAGFSWGGISNLFAAARDNRIGALVALDGSLRFSPGLVKLAGDVHPEQMTIPLLSIAQHYFSFEDLDTLPQADKDGPSVLKAWTHGDLVRVHMLRLFHAEYSAMYQRSDNVWWNIKNVWSINKADYGREDSIMSYGWIARYTRAFLDAYLKHDAEAAAFLKKKPTENGVPKNVMAMEYSTAAGVAPSFDGFRAEIGRRGFNRLAEVYAAIRKEEPDFRLDQPAVANWSEELLNGGHVSEAIALLELNVQMYPESSEAHTILGDAYRKGSQQQAAIESYAKALEKDPPVDDAALIQKKREELKSSK